MKNFASGAACGLVLGVVTMGVVLRRPVTAITKQDKTYKARQEGMLNDIVSLAEPYVPGEVLKKIL